MTTAKSVSFNMTKKDTAFRTLYSSILFVT